MRLRHSQWPWSSENAKANLFNATTVKSLSAPLGYVQYTLASLTGFTVDTIHAEQL